MDIVFGNYTYPLFSFEYFLQSMDQMGIRNIELWAAAPHFYVGDATPAVLRKAKKQFEKHRLQVVCLTPEQCCYPVNIAAKEAAMRKRSLSYFKKAIEAAAFLEIPQLIITPGQGYRDEPREDALLRSAESLTDLAFDAEKHGVLLLLEHLTQTTTNLAVYAKELKEMVDRVGHPNLQYMVDTDMMARVGESVGDYLAVFQKNPSYVHLVDGMPGGHLVPGDGRIPLKREVERLAKNGYDGCLSFEITNELYLLDPNLAVKRTQQWLSQNNPRLST